VKKIGTLANIFGVDLIPHTWGTGIAIHAAMHLLSNLDLVPGRMYKPLPWMELDQTENDLRDKLTRPLTSMKDGLIKVPDSPGLGIEINEDMIDEYRIDTVGTSAEL